MSLISCAQMVGNPRIASDPAAAPATAAAPFKSVRRLSFFADVSFSPAWLAPDLPLSLSSMATLVGYNERFAPIAIDRLRCDRLAARLWAQFHEVKLEVKIR